MRDTHSDNILRPALLKCYNAFESLRKLSVDNSFYDNISNLDNFLIEYRSITFAIQKSLGGENNPIYQKNLNKYLKGEIGKWLVQKRNMVDHEYPFDLGKRLTITVYNSISAEEIYQKDFDVDSEQPLMLILESLKEVMLSFHLYEVYFSCSFQFIENDKQKYDIYPFVKEGVSLMKQFLKGMYDDLMPNDRISDDLMSKIMLFPFDRISKDMLFVHDYVFYVKNDKFERGYFVNLRGTDKKLPVDSFTKQYGYNDSFILFMFLHIHIYKMQEQNLMPTFMIVYKDNTYTMQSYGYNMRTTMYRIINKIANLIKSDEVKEVYIVTETYFYSDDDINEVMKMSYSERIKTLKTETKLSFFRVNNDMTYNSFMFNSSDIIDDKFSNMEFENSMKYSTEVSFLTPLFNAFQAKARQNCD